LVVALLIAAGIRFVNGATAITILFAAPIAASVIFLGIQSGVNDLPADGTVNRPKAGVKIDPSAGTSDAIPNESGNVISVAPAVSASDTADSSPPPSISLAAASDKVDLIASALELVTSLASDSKGRIAVFGAPQRNTMAPESSIRRHI
jgi:hypothetical protein